VKYRKPLPNISGREQEARDKIQRSVLVVNGCWEWQRFRNRIGYGWTNFSGISVAAHRLSYMAFKAPFDPMRDVCHTCDNRRCCNPDHLWLGTMKENIRDSQQKGRHFLSSRTACPKGHEYSPENTAIHIDLRGHRHRRCITCERERGKRWDPRRAEWQRARRARNRAASNGDAGI
jgi:hypothetical protein